MKKYIPARPGRQSDHKEGDTYGFATPAKPLETEQEKARFRLTYPERYQNYEPDWVLG